MSHPAGMGLIIDSDRLGPGVPEEGFHIGSPFQEQSHIPLEGVGAWNQVEDGLGGLDGGVAVGVVGLIRLPLNHRFAAANCPLLQLDGALAQDQGNKDAPDMFSDIVISQAIDQALVEEGTLSPQRACQSGISPAGGRERSEDHAGR